MRIVSNGFKHGRVNFEKGKRYAVPDARGGYFVGCGWASEAAADDPGPFITVDPAELGPDAPARAPEDSATLEVQDSVIGQAAPKIGGK